MNGRRELTAAVLGSAAAGALGLLAGGRVWVTVTVARADPLPPSRVEVAGATLAPLVPGLALVVLAAAVALLATRRWGRIAVGALVAACGAGLLVASLSWVGAPDAAAAARIADLPVGTASASAALSPWLGVGAGLLAAVVGPATVLRSRTWPGMGARYDAPAPAADIAAAPADLTERQVWDALDRGEDPTRGQPSAAADPGRADEGADRRITGPAYSHRHHGPITRGTGNQ